MPEVRLLEEHADLKKITHDQQIIERGFTCIGHLAEITNNLNHERLWLWCDEAGNLIITHDEGNSACHVTSAITSPNV